MCLIISYKIKPSEYQQDSNYPAKRVIIKNCNHLNHTSGIEGSCKIIGNYSRLYTDIKAFFG